MAQQQEREPQIEFIRKELDELIQKLRATEREYPGDQVVKKVITDAIDVLRAAEDKIEGIGPTWFILR